MSEIRSIVEQLVSFSPRQLEGETKTLDYVRRELEKAGLAYRLQEFQLELPRYPSYYLMADGKAVGGKPCAFVSGEITDKKALHNTLLDPNLCEEANLNFSPMCPGHSLATFYFAPALALNHAELAKILAAKEIHGSVTVERAEHNSANILVGNLTKPQWIIFAHIDSIETGAVDNASGVAVMLMLLKEQPELLTKHLFIFSGCEELSFARPYYWGYGFRVFEKAYEWMMADAQEIIVIDSVGQTPASIYDHTELELMRQAFPIEHMEEWRERIKIIAGEIDPLMTIYHSELDVLNQVHEEHLVQAKELLHSRLQKLSPVNGS